MSRAMMEDTYPPVVTECPDYWDVSLNGSQKTCITNGVVNAPRHNDKCDGYPVSGFNVSGSRPEDIICEKYKWAKDCKIAWDGITNNNDACKNSRVG